TAWAAATTASRAAEPAWRAGSPAALATGPKDHVESISGCMGAAYLGSVPSDSRDTILPLLRAARRQQSVFPHPAGLEGRAPGQGFLGFERALRMSHANGSRLSLLSGSARADAVASSTAWSQQRPGKPG